MLKNVEDRFPRNDVPILPSHATSLDPTLGDGDGSWFKKHPKKHNVLRSSSKIRIDKVEMQTYFRIPKHQPDRLLSGLQWWLLRAVAACCLECASTASQLLFRLNSQHVWFLQVHQQAHPPTSLNETCIDIDQY